MEGGEPEDSTAALAGSQSWPACVDDEDWKEIMGSEFDENVHGLKANRHYRRWMEIEAGLRKDERSGTNVPASPCEKLGREMDRQIDGEVDNEGGDMPVDVGREHASFNQQAVSGTMDWGHCPLAPLLAPMEAEFNACGEGVETVAQYAGRFWQGLTCTRAQCIARVCVERWQTSVQWEKALRRARRMEEVGVRMMRKRGYVRGVGG